MSSQPAARRILTVALGSFGDVHPVIGVARKLQCRGHRVSVIANPLYAEVIERAGLELIPVGTSDEFLRIIENPKMWSPFHGMKALGGGLILPYMRPVFEIIRERLSEDPVVAAPVTVFGARIAQEALGVKLATINLQPATVRSLEDIPGLPFIPRGRALLPLARVMRRGAYAIADNFFFDPVLRKPVNAFRAELGLAPVRHPFGSWFESPELVIGLFPDWFGKPQPDWSKQIRCTGFPLYDEAEHRALDPALERFLDAGDPPIVFTPGTAMRHAAEFFATSVKAVERLGRRAILLSHFPEQIPDRLPETIAHFDYAPFSQVLPRAAALVYHGGIGTAAQALKAGVPHLVMPLSFDQPDNAERLRRLGVGATIWEAFYSAARVARTLDRLTTSPAVAAACRGLAARVDRDAGLDQTARLMEAL